MKNFYFFALVVLTTFFSCTQDELNTPESLLDDIQGEWLEVEEGIAYAGSNHHLIIEGDQVKLTHLLWTDIILVGEACSGNRTDYAKGTVTITEDNFTFLGSYCNESFSEITPNCLGNESYDLIYDYTLEDGILTLNPEAPFYSQIRLEKQD